MKKKLLVPGLLLLMGALSLSSCGDDPANGRDGKGRIAPVVGVDTGFLGMEIISRAGEEDRKVEDLSLTLTKSDGSFEQTWASVADFDPEAEFPIGDYKVEVSYGNQEDEGFDKKAAYYDSQDIKVYENESTPVSLNAVRTHAMITIKYTDAFEHYIQTAGVKIHTASDKTITFQYNDDNPETRSALIVPGTTTVSIDMERYNGTWVRNFFIKSFETEARAHYTLTLDVNKSELGNPMLQVVFDNNVEEDVIDVDISDEVINAGPPEIILNGITPGQCITVVDGTYSEDDSISATIIAKGFITSVNLNVKSTCLENATWKAAADANGDELIGMSKEDQDTYTQNGLECHGIWNQPGQLAFIDFTKVIAGLKYNESDKNNKKNISTFTLNVTDRNGNTPETGPVSFSVEILPVELSLLNPSYLRLDDTEMDLELSFNGGDPTSKVTFKAKDFNGFVNVDAVMTKKAENLYSVHLSNMPTYYDSNNGNITTIQAEFGVKTYNLNVERHGVIAEATDNNIFAKRALVTLTPINVDEADIANPKFALKTNNKALQFEKYAENTYIVKELEAGQINEVAITFDKPAIYCPLLTIETEEAKQLPNSGMEDWTYKQVGNYQTLWYVGNGNSGWATMNPLTTSQSGGTGTTNTAARAAYSATSGTRPANANVAKEPSATYYENNQKSGTNAAVIRTVGWGKGNTSWQNYGGKCEHITPGELFLGSTNADYTANRGIEFPSRPSALKFYAKYVPYKENNGDYGVATIIIRDASGDSIAGNKYVFTELMTSYKSIELPLSYTFGKAKGAKIEVNFKSSDNPECLKFNSNYTSGSGSANLTTNEIVGSQLYIDDIELIYE